MASQVVGADKRYRISLLLDAYGELLTVKQRTFLRHYYEQDLSFGEIAREYAVSRQAIFDSVKHGEEALEQFEKVMRLVESGWLRVTDGGLTPGRLLQALVSIRDRLSQPDHGLAAELDALIDQLNVLDDPPAMPGETERSE